MAKDSEPRARPITVSELIARSEAGGSAFPKSASEEDRRSVRRAGASGMPAHPPVPAPDTPPSDVPASDAADSSTAGPETGTKPSDPDANAVTGIIPVVRDDDDDTASLEPVPADDLVGVDLPAVDTANDDAPDEGVPDEGDTGPAVGLMGPAVDEPESEHRRVASSADLEAAQKAEDKARAKAEKEEKAAAKKAKKAEKESHGKSALVGWLALLGEVLLGLALGAGLFWGFTELWKRYVYLALVLAVLVIFAIVTFAHVLRKRDLPTTLLALGVGMLVTIGPLVLLAA